MLLENPPVILHKGKPAPQFSLHNLEERGERGGAAANAILQPVPGMKLAWPHTLFSCQVRRREEVGLRRDRDAWAPSRGSTFRSHSSMATQNGEAGEIEHHQLALTF